MIDNTRKITRAGTTFSNCRPKHAHFIHVRFKSPVQCGLDAYMRMECTHQMDKTRSGRIKQTPPPGSICAICVQNNPHDARLVDNVGALVRFTPSPQKEKPIRKQRMRTKHLRMQVRNHGRRESTLAIRLRKES